MSAAAFNVDVVIFGGGAAGLWLLDELRRAGYAAVLLEAHALGAGQTIASQGILHGGLKYTLDGLFSPAAEAIREMPQVWRECLAGRRAPELGGVRLRSPHCYLWRTREWMSRLGMLGAKVGLRVKPVKLERAEWPAALAGCAGEVYRLDEQVIEPGSFLETLAQGNAAWLLKVDAERVQLDCGAPGRVASIRIEQGAVGGVCDRDQTRATAGRDGPGQRPLLEGKATTGGRVLDLRPRAVVLTAGRGNAELRQCVGLPAELMQLRPLHMVYVRGTLPPLHGHCTDGARTRVTITSTGDTQGRTVWQVGGQVAEDGVRMAELDLLRHAKAELATVLPGLSLDGLEWSADRIDRAEAATAAGQRPDDAFCRREGNVITAWPTKLVLSPRLARQVRKLLEPPAGDTIELEAALRDWPRPTVAIPPWETERTWRHDH